MYKKFQIILASAIAVSAINAFAIEKPAKLASDSRIEVVDYSSTNVVPIHGTTFTTTQITFGDDEYIENIQNGDLGAWTASVDKDLPNMLFVKPTTYNSATNMTVVTNKYTYYFYLTSNGPDQDSQKDATYAIHFEYPQEQQAKTEKAILDREQQKKAELSALQNPADYNWDYSFNGDKTIVPVHVFDDGKFTYMQMQNNQDIPAIFSVTSSNGDESVVNYRQDGRYLVIQMVAPQFTLRDGKNHVATIFDNKSIAQQ